MQSRNAIIAIIVLILVVLGVWYWTTTPGQGGSGPMATSTPDMASTTATTTGSTTSNSGGAGAPAKGSTLHTLASQTSNFTCTLTAVSSSGQATGVIYGAGGKVRVDFTIPSNNGSVVSHVIRSNGYSYSWVDGQSTGTKAAITAGAITAPAQGGVISVDSASATECHPWVPDSTQFVPPKGISFVAR